MASKPSYSYQTLPFNCATLLSTSVSRALPRHFPPLTVPSRSSHDAYIVGSAGKKGLGLFARRPIRTAGETILVERPVIIAPLSTVMMRACPDEIYAALFKMLDEKTRARAEALANAFDNNPGRIYEGIVRTNAFGIRLHGEGEDGVHRALFLNAARCNHSCTPNAGWRWNATAFSLELYALQPIPVGDEITISYLPSEKKDRLLKSFNFTCLCSSCSHPRTRTAPTLSFEDWLVSDQPASVLIEDPTVDADTKAMCYGALGDRSAFRKWLKAAKKLRSGDEAIVLDVWYEEPELFPLWGWKR